MKILWEKSGKEKASLVIVKTSFQIQTDDLKYLKSTVDEIRSRNSNSIVIEIISQTEITALRCCFPKKLFNTQSPSIQRKLSDFKRLYFTFSVYIVRLVNCWCAESVDIWSISISPKRLRQNSPRKSLPAFSQIC